MKPGEQMPEYTGGRLRWLAQTGTLRIVKEDYVWCRQSPWEITVEIGALNESHIKVTGDNLFDAAGDAINAIRDFWENPPWKKSKDPYSAGGVVIDEA